MSILDTFFILFEGDTSKLDKGVQEADKKGQGLIERLHLVDEAANKTGTGFMGLMSKVAGLAGVGLSLGMLVKGVRDTAKEYQHLGMLAARFRSTVEDVHAFTEESKLLGISQEDAEHSLEALSNAMQDASMGFGRAQKVFAQMHIALRDGQGHVRSTTAVLAELQKRMAGMDRGKQIRVMERLGLDPALLKLFNTDLSELQRRTEAIDRATGFNLDTAVRRSQEYTKASKEMGVEFNLLRMYLGKMAEGFKLSTMPYFTEALRVATKYTRMFTDYLVQHAPFVQGVVIAIGAAISAYLVPAAIRGAISVWAMVAPFLAVGAAVVGVGLLFALLYDDIVNFMQGNDSLIGAMLKKWPIIGDVFRGIVAVLRFVAEVARDVGRILWAEIGIVAGKLANGFAWLAEKAADVGEFIGEAFAQAAAYIRENFGGVVEFFTSVGESVKDTIKGWIDLIAAFIDKVVGLVKLIPNGIRSVLSHAKNELDIHDDRPPVTAGALPPQTAAAVAAGRAQLHAATTSPLAAHTSQSIAHLRTVRGGDRTVHIDKVEVNTQATDADGIARNIGQTLGSHMRQATSQFDDGVDR